MAEQSANVVTEADVRKATMRLTLALDGDHYHNQHQCVEFPELTRVDTGPNSRQFTGREPLGPHTKTYYVDGKPVERSATAITAAINEHRQTTAPTTARQGGGG